MKRITIDGKEFDLVPVDAEIRSNYPTMNEIFEKTVPKYWVDSDGTAVYSVRTPDFDCVPTKEDAEHIAASIQLINIAAYYNAMFPDEKKFKYLFYDKQSLEFCFGHNQSIARGEVLFTESAAKQALSNPNVVEVLQKYFRISK